MAPPKPLTPIHLAPGPPSPVPPNTPNPNRPTSTSSHHHSGNNAAGGAPHSGHDMAAQGGGAGVGAGAGAVRSTLDKMYHAAAAAAPSYDDLRHAAHDAVVAAASTASPHTQAADARREKHDAARHERAQGRREEVLQRHPSKAEADAAAAEELEEVARHATVRLHHAV